MYVDLTACSRRALLRASAACLTAAPLASLSPSRAAAAPADQGEWSPVYSWPQVAVHLIVLPDGRVLTFTDNYGTGGDLSQAHVVDIPEGGAPSSTWYHPNTGVNLFCAGHAFLPDGRLLIVGGQRAAAYYQGIAQATVFDTAAGYTWTAPANGMMSDLRWYPSVITLATGEILAIGGTRNGETDPNKVPEVWNVGDGGWRRLTSAAREVALYPWAFQAPNGRVFLAGNWQQTRYLTTTGNGAWSTGPLRLHANRSYGSVVMYDTGRILALGGGSPATATAEVLDLRAKAPAWRWTAPMRHARRYPNATVLPDGKVLVTGGGAGANDTRVAVLAAELWDPATGSWATMASMQVPRLYHSSAVLLPDGRVLSAGGGRPAAKNGVNNHNAEIYSPPYLFRGTRPAIDSAPPSVRYGEIFAVGTRQAALIAQVTLVRLSSTTHCFNMNQRFCRLPFALSPDGLSVTAPSSSRLAPPGHYMLFILDGAGVPSAAKILQLA